jgi:hypothetical protein
MKVKTNLTPGELELVSKGLAKLAETQHPPYVPENNAETELLRKADSIFDQFVDFIQDDISKVLFTKD